MRSGNTAEWYQFLCRLKDNHVEFVIIGGVAAILRGSPVATFDLYLCAPMTDENLAKIHHALIDLGPVFRFRPDRLPVPSDPARLKGFRNLNLGTSLGDLDILGELPGICSYDELATRVTTLDLDGLHCRVLDVPTLLAAKRYAGREKDRENIRFLEAIERQDARQAKMFEPPPSDHP